MWCESKAWMCTRNARLFRRPVRFHICLPNSSHLYETL